MRIKIHLKKDGLIIYPTDTLYGIGCNFYSVKALAKIDKVKARLDLPYSVAVSDINMLGEIVKDIPELFNKFYKEMLPGKFTLLLDPAKSVNKKLVKGSDKIGIRIPEIPGIIRLIKFLGFPIVSTSVNKSGKPPLNSPDEIESFLNNEVSVPLPELLFIDKGILPLSKGSTVIKFSDNNIELVRKGDEYLKFEEFIKNINSGRR